MTSVLDLFSTLKTSLSSITDEFEQESFIILEHGLSKTRAQLLYSFHDELEVDESRRVLSLLDQRLTGKPLAYCLNQIDFMMHTYILNEHVLIPRPETEQLVECAIEFLREHPRITNILECGIGSGVISLELAHYFQNRIIKGWDNSLLAYDCAEHNRQRLNCQNCEFICGDFFNDDLKPTEDTLIISNPPYIPTSDILELSSVVKDFEPHCALDGGADGLVYYRKIINLFDTYSFVFIAEIGVNQLDALADMTKHLNVTFLKDYEGIDRLMIVHRIDYRH